jgi:hypothetical protein
MPEGKVNFFTCTAKGIEKGSGEEFIAVGTCAGEIYAVTLNGSTFTKSIGFTMQDQSAIMAMSSDSRS